MKRTTSFIFSLLCLGLLNAQSNVKVTFSNAIALNIKQLESDTPEVVKKHTMERIQNIRFLSCMTIEDELVYYEIKSKSIDNKESEKIATSTTKYYMVPSIQIKIPEEKYLKNNKENSIASYVDKKLQSEKLPSITWKKSGKQKKILGYNCYEAKGILEGKPVSIYYTTEIKGSGSPEKIPFINGVILEYTTNKRSGVATKVEFNQPKIKNFFK